MAPDLGREPEKNDWESDFFPERPTDQGPKSFQDFTEWCHTHVLLVNTVTGCYCNAMNPYNWLRLNYDEGFEHNS